MSAYMVSKRHIDALVTAGLHGRYRLRWFVPAPVNPEAYQRGEAWGPAAIAEANERRRELTEETAGRVGAMLLAENARSVNHRYDEEDIEEPYLYEPCLSRRVEGERFSRPLKAVDVLCLLDGYEYQACEHPEWEDSEARAFCDALRRHLIKRVPGYDDAPWSI